VGQEFELGLEDGGLAYGHDLVVFDGNKTVLDDAKVGHGRPHPSPSSLS